MAASSDAAIPQPRIHQGVEELMIVNQAAPGGGGFNILQSLQNAFTTFLNYVPNVIGALLVLIIGYIIARLIRAGISRLLRKIRVDEKLTHGSGGEYVARFSPQGRPSQLVGLVVQYVLMVFVIVSAVGTLNIPAVTGFVNLVLSYRACHANCVSSGRTKIDSRERHGGREGRPSERRRSSGS